MKEDFSDQAMPLEEEDRTTRIEVNGSSAR
jgi:hypothetical protein